MDNQDNQIETAEAPTTFEVGLRYGSILTVISMVLFLIPAVLAQNPFKGVWNWVGIGVTMAIIVLAQTKFKSEGTGFMSFGQGVAITFWIALISVSISILFSFVYTSFIDDGPFELFMIQQEDELLANGTPENMIETSLEWTRKLFWVIGYVAGIFFTMIMGFVISIFTKKQSPEAPF